MFDEEKAALVHTGSCLCRAIQFEVSGELAPIQLCHCSVCRKAQGGPFGANIPVTVKDFRLLCGEAEMASYESSPGKERVFCRRCGGPLFSRLASLPDRIRLRAGTLDAPTGGTLGFNFHVASKADWWEITDDLPQYPDARPT